jgi:hypothetical protein
LEVEEKTLDNKPEGNGKDDNGREEVFLVFVGENLLKTEKILETDLQIECKNKGEIKNEEII